MFKNYAKPELMVIINSADVITTSFNEGQDNTQEFNWGDESHD